MEDAGLPSLDVGPVSARASETAERLLEAYYFQDERETHLLRGDAAAAVDAGRRAVGRMADVYEVEFPDVPRPLSRRAGEQFARALFVQDEIENWRRFLDLPCRERTADVLVSDLDASYGTAVCEDDRWATVRACLTDVCSLVGIERDYAPTMARFWLLHGQRESGWTDLARQAHDSKLRAMVDEPTPREAAALGEYFVAGVEGHDGWTRRDRDDDLDGVVGVVAEYYQKVFEMRDEPCGGAGRALERRDCERGGAAERGDL